MLFCRYGPDAVRSSFVTIKSGLLASPDTMPSTASVPSSAPSSERLSRSSRTILGAVALLRWPHHLGEDAVYGEPMVVKVDVMNCGIVGAQSVRYELASHAMAAAPV